MGPTWCLILHFSFTANFIHSTLSIYLSIIFHIKIKINLLICDVVLLLNVSFS